MEPVKDKKRDEFNKRAAPGMLILWYGDEPRSYRADQVTFMHQNGGYVSVEREGREERHYLTNFSVVHHFYMEALRTGQSYDFRDICSLEKKDPLYKEYQDVNASDEVKRQLARRVRKLTPDSFI